MKFTNISNKLGDLVLNILHAIPILVLLGSFGALVYVDIYLSTPVFTFMWFLLLPALGLGVNWCLGWILGDQFYNTGLVREGRSILDVEKTPKYYTRRMFLCIIECFLFALVMVRFITFLPSEIASSIVGIIGSIVGIVIYFIIGMSSYEQSSMRTNKILEGEIEESKPAKKEVKKKPLNKFKFDDYPELLDKYNSFKCLNRKKQTTSETEEDKKQAQEAIDKAFENLALAVFNIFNEIKPKLIVKKTGETVNWKDVINKPFEELSYTEKLILVRLLDRLYKYVLPNKYYNL